MNMDKITIKKSQFGDNPIDNGDEITIIVDSLSDISDGYHTIAEIYEHRIVLYIELCRSRQSFKYHGDSRNQLGDEKIVWRSKLHNDGTAYDGWFIMGIGKNEGEQISYHLPLSYWSATDFADTLDKAPKWDGHTSEDVLTRLKNL